LHRAHTLPQLFHAAESTGFRRALSSSFDVIITDPSLVPGARDSLSRIVKWANIKTVAELLGDSRVQGMLGQLPPTQRAMLVNAARRFLLANGPDPEGTAPPPAPSRPEAAPAAPRQINSQPPRTRPELLAWADSLGMRDILQLPAQVLTDVYEHPPQVVYRLGGAWNLDVCAAYLQEDSRGWLRQVFSQSQLKELQSFVRRFLSDEAERVLQALAGEHVVTGDVPLGEPLLQELIERLLEARAVVRRSVFPRVGQDDGEVSLIREPPALRFRGTGLPWEREKTRTLTINLEQWKTAPLTAECSCPEKGRPGHGRGSCRHALVALDCAILSVRAVADKDVGKDLAELLRQPAWARVLRTLDDVRTKFRPRKESVEETRLAWKLHVEHGRVAAEVLLRKPLKKGGFSAGSRISWADMLRRSHEGWSPADRRAIEALFPDGRPEMVYGEGLPRGRLYRALSRLAEGADVTCSGCGKAIAIKSARLGMVPQAQGGDAFTLAPAAGDEPLPFEELSDLAKSQRADDLILRFDHETHTMTIIEADDEALALAEVFGQRQVPFPAESFGELFDRVQTLQEHLPITLPPALRGDEIPPAKTMVVRLKPLPDAGLVAHILARPFPGGATFVPGVGGIEVLGTVDGKRVHVQRSLADELATARTLTDRLALRPETEDPDFTYTLTNGDDALDLVAKLQHETDPDLVVEWPERARQVTRPAQIKNLHMRVTQRRDWFGLEGEAQVDDARIDLAVVLDALRRRRRYVQVRDGMWLALSDSLREKLTPLADQASGSEKTATLGLAGALAVEELSDELGEFEAVAGFSTLLERIRTARKWEPPAPSGMKGVLRDYQLAGYKWLARLSSWGTGAVLADDMGLGKTIQALALLTQRGKAGPSLVVAPTSVCGNWIRETQKFAPSLKPALFREIPAADRPARLKELRAGDLLVVSYGLLVREAANLAETKFSTLVLDESQAIKNADTLRAKAARQIQAEFKVALTGTPLENHLGELWSLYRVIFPGLFGSWDEFRDRFVNREEPEQGTGKTSPRATLARQIRPFLLRRTKQEVAPELPPRTEMEERIDLSPAERRLYEDARLAAVAKLNGTNALPDEQKRFEVLAALTRLRLCASHPALYDPTEKAPSSKLNRFLEIVTEIGEENHRALVFSQFTKHLALIRQALDQRGITYLYLDGQTPPARRDELVDAFQAGAAPLFLISLKAGGTGLNLTGADYVIHLDPWWNPAVEDQATDRAHRIGQTRPVTVVRLVAKGTIEEQILSLHASKRTLVANVLEGSDAAARVSTSELIDLIREGAAARAGEDDESDEAKAVVEPVVPVKTTGLPERAPKRQPGPGKTEPTKSAPTPPGISEKLPDWLHNAGPASETGVEAFRVFLVKGMAESSAGTYVSALRRFITFASDARQRGQWEPGDGLEALVTRYLSALESGEVKAAKSYPQFVRAMLSKLRLFVAAGQKAL
jgi:superfamily II DNA or RNA helicase